MSLRLTFAQVAVFYDDAHTGLVLLDPDAKHPWAEWASVMRVNALFYRALAQFHQGALDQENSNYGLEVCICAL